MWHSRDTDERKNVITTVKIKFNIIYYVCMSMNTLSYFANHTYSPNKIHTPHMYIQFSILSPFQRFILISAFYPHFSFRFQFQFPPFSFSVLSQPFIGIYPPENNFRCFITQSSRLASHRYTLSSS